MKPYVASQVHPYSDEGAAVRQATFSAQAQSVLRMTAHQEEGTDGFEAAAGGTEGPWTGLLAAYGRRRIPRIRSPTVACTKSVVRQVGRGGLHELS